MAPVSDEPTELSPDDLVEEPEEPTAQATTVKRDPNLKTARPPALNAAPLPPGFPSIEEMIADARRRAESAAAHPDRIALARARIELAILLEVLRHDAPAALGEYRTAHAIAPSAAAPIAAARRLTPQKPIAPALSLLEAELRLATDERTRIARLLELGRLLLLGGAAPDKAVHAFQELLAIDPDHPAGLRGMESALRSLPRAHESGTTLDALAAHLEAMASAWRAERRLSAWLEVERAFLLGKRKRPDAARAALEGAMQLDGGLGPVRDAYTRHLIACQDISALANALADEASLEGDTARAGRLFYAAARLASERLDLPALAIDLYRRATSLDATPVATRRAALRELSRLYEVSGARREAIEAEQQLLLWVDDVERPYWHKRLARSLEALDQWNEVALHAQEALRAAPDDEETRDRLDRALSRADRHDERRALFFGEATRASNAAQRVNALLRAAEIAENDLDDRELALSTLRAAFATDAEDVRVVDHLARLLVPAKPAAAPDSSAHIRARIDFYAEAAANAAEPGRKVTYLERLALLWEDEARDPLAALAAYREILAIEPDRTSAILGLERNAARAGDSAELFRALVMEADRAKNPPTERGLLLRAADLASAELGDAEGALDLVARVLAKNGGDTAALYCAYRIHKRTGHYDEAANQLRVLLQHTRKGPGAFGILIELATLLESRLRRRDEALAVYREAFRLDPTSPIPAAEIRRILLLTDGHRPFADELSQMAAATPNPERKARLLLEAAEIYADRLDDADKAIALLNQARSVSPGDLEIVERLERAYTQKNKLGELVALIESLPEKSPRETFTLALLLADDRDPVRASSLLLRMLAEDKGNVPALRTLERTLSRTDQLAELAGVLRLEATMFETTEAKLGAASELWALEELRGVPPQTPSAIDLARSLCPDDVLVHESVLKRHLARPLESEVATVVASLTVLAEAATDGHLAATLQLAAGLLLERYAAEHEQNLRHDALRRYRAALDGWPECLIAARGMRRLAERLGDTALLIEGSAALGNLESEAKVRAERLIEAAEALGEQRGEPAKIATLFARALGEDPGSDRAAQGLLSVAFEGSLAGPAVDALRHALDRTTSGDQAVLLGGGLFELAKERLHDPTVALEALRRVRKKAPGNVNNLLRLAGACIELGLVTDAAEAASSAIGITREPRAKAEAVVLLAEAHASAPDSKEAACKEAEQAEKLIEALPIEHRPDLFARLAPVLGKLGREPELVRVLARAVLFSSKTEKPLGLLASAFAMETVAGATAFCQTLEQVMHEAARLQVPVEPAWIAAIGKVEATILSRPREGIAKLKEAILRGPARVETFASLAEVYGVLGAHEEAVQELLAILPKVALQNPPLDRMLLIFELFARECEAARRTVQAKTAEAIVACLGQDAVFAPPPVPAGAPVPLSLAPTVLRSSVIAPELSSPWLDVATILVELVPKLLYSDPSAMGLQPRDRLPARAPHPLRALADRLARAFGDLRFDLFVEAASASVPRIVVPSETPAIVLPRGYGDLPENEQAAGIGRLLVYIALDMPWLEEVSREDLEGLLFGALRFGYSSFGEGLLLAGPDANADLWRGRIAKVGGRKQKRPLEEIAERAQKFVDPHAFRRNMRAASARAAYLLTGDPVSTLNHMVRIDRELSQATPRDLPERLLVHPMTRDLIFYALSTEAVGLRRAVGTG